MYTLPSHQLAPKGLVVQLVEHHTGDVSIVGLIPTQVLRFSFPRKENLGTYIQVLQKKNGLNIAWGFGAHCQSFEHKISGTSARLEAIMLKILQIFCSAIPDSEVFQLFSKIIPIIPLIKSKSLNFAD